MEAEPWVILGRVLAPAPGDAEHDDHLTMAGGLPPQVAVFTAGPNAHPNPTLPDMYPYILAANRSHLLLNCSVWPYRGASFSTRPRDSNLRVVPFGTLGPAAHPLPARDGSVSIIRDLQSIGIVSRDAVAAEPYVFAELMVERGSRRARVVCFRSDAADRWEEKRVPYPLHDADRDWAPNGVVSNSETLWWFDLSWGILTCNPFQVCPVLLFVGLPEGRALGMANPGILDRRCITDSNNFLRYVEIIVGEAGAAKVSMWTQIPVPIVDGDWRELMRWEMVYEVDFKKIWDDKSYEVTKLPRVVPVLAIVCPTNPDLVYFSLDKRLFGVDVPLHKVVEFIDMDYLELVIPWRPEPAPWSYLVLPWILPPVVVAAQGIHPFNNGLKGPPRALESGDNAAETSTVLEHDTGTESGDSAIDTSGSQSDIQSPDN